MPGAISITGLSADDPVPGSYLQIDFAQGEAAGSGGPIEVLLMGNLLSTGSATVDTIVYGPDSIVQLVTEQDAIDLFGTGSELHRMFRRFVRVNKTTICPGSMSAWLGTRALVWARTRRALTIG